MMAQLAVCGVSHVGLSHGGNVLAFRPTSSRRLVNGGGRRKAQFATCAVQPEEDPPKVDRSEVEKILQAKAGSEVLEKYREKLRKKLQETPGPDDVNPAASLEAGRAAAEEYKAKVQAALAEEAEKEAELLRQAEQKLKVGEFYYDKGEYAKSASALEEGMAMVAGSSMVGGQIMIWLAMAYEAQGRNAECIELLKEVNKKHPDDELRKQAGDLKFIYEAPKLALSKDDFVAMPLVQDLDRRGKKSWKGVKKYVAPPGEKPFDFDEYIAKLFSDTRPRWQTNKYVWAAAAVLLTGLGIYFNKR
eukprot:jgi/Mesvir1/29070/Mv18377-RA.1